MENQIEIMKQATELLEAMEEALNHVHNKVKEGGFEVTYPVFVDIIQSFSTLEGVVRKLPKEIIPESNAELTDKLRSAFELTVSYYETRNNAKIVEVMRFTLIPSFNRWRRGLDEGFEKYLMN